MRLSNPENALSVQCNLERVLCPRPCSAFSKGAMPGAVKSITPAFSHRALV